MESQGRVWIYIPAKMGADSAFPFRKGERVIIKIDPKTQEIRISRKGRK